MDGTIVKLSKPIDVFGRTIKEVALKEPSGQLYMRLGEPRIGVATAESGSWYFVEQSQVINNYLNKLLVYDGVEDIPTEAVLSQISLVDAIALKRALWGFFDIAATKVVAASSR